MVKLAPQKPMTVLKQINLGGKELLTKSLTQFGQCPKKISVRSPLTQLSLIFIFPAMIHSRRPFFLKKKYQTIMNTVFDCNSFEF